MKSSFKKALKFLCLSDHEGNLSITNIAVIVIISKIAVSAFDWVTAAGLLMTLVNYGHKRTESAKADLEAKRAERNDKERASEFSTEQKIRQVQDQMAADKTILKRQIDAQQDSIKHLEAKAEEQNKVVEEAKTMITATKLAASQRGRSQL